MIPAWILAVGIAVLVLGAAYGIRNQINGLIGRHTVGGPIKPTIWWYVDDGEVNAREWLDWENRSTREPNEPYLKICQARAIDLWGSLFNVVPVIGRRAALERLGEKDGLNSPPELFLPWCRAAFLNKFGGLWLDGSVLPMGTGVELHQRLAGKDVLTFGADPSEAIVAANQTGPAAGESAGWAAVPGHPMWAGLYRDISALVAEGAQSWSAPEARRSMRWLWDKHCSGITSVDRTAEISRDRYGRRLELDTLLDETEWPTGETTGGLWVPWPDGRTGLERASTHLWFLRLSVDQIRDSEFLWARWATKV